MDSRHGKMRMNLEGDRLSSLPDDIIHRIISSFNIKYVIGLGVLSSRWRFIWTSLPYLNFSTEDFFTLPRFSKFVTNVLSHRNNLAEVYSLKLNFRIKASHALVKRILNYAFSHNIQQLNVVCLLENDIEFPLSCFSSQTLKHLSVKMQISRYCRHFHQDCYLTSTWELPTLTTLDLDSVILCDDEADKCIGVFSKCANLQNLRLNRFKTKGSNGFSIVHPRLSNLTLENGYSVKVVNLATPQLRNLTIRSSPAEYAISAPDLSYLFYKGSHPLHLSTEGLHSLEKADICISSPQDAHAQQIVCMLQQLHNVKFLTLNLEIVEILSSSVDLILQQPSPFVNLMSLKIYPETLLWWDKLPKKVTIMSTKVKSYLLASSPGSSFTVVLREFQFVVGLHFRLVELGVYDEKCRVYFHVSYEFYDLLLEIKAQKIIAELEAILEKEKNNISTDRARLERWKAQMESHKRKSKMKLKIGGNMAQIESSWENFGVQFQQREKKALLIISKLKDIEELLTKMPASKRAEIQQCFYSLCAEADIVITQITDCIKIHCDENQSLSSVRFQQLATTLERSK